jgi:hypothetical protein
MTEYLQTGLATGSRTISHTRFKPVYIGLYTDSWALSSTLLCKCSLLFTPVHCAAPLFSFIYLLKVLKGGPCPSKSSDCTITINVLLRSQITCLGMPQTVHLPIPSGVHEALLRA